MSKYKRQSLWDRLSNCTLQHGNYLMCQKVEELERRIRILEHKNKILQTQMHFLRGRREL